VARWTHVIATTPALDSTWKGATCIECQADDRAIAVSGPHFVAVVEFNAGELGSLPAEREGTVDATVRYLGMPASRFGPHCRILQVRWHPLEPSVLTVLTVESLLFFSPLDITGDGEGRQLAPVGEYRFDRSRFQGSSCLADFSFGAGRGWEQMAVYFALTDGSVFVTCPLLPPGAAVTT